MSFSKQGLKDLNFFVQTVKIDVCVCETIFQLTQKENVFMFLNESQYEHRVHPFSLFF